MKITIGGPEILYTLSCVSFVNNVSTIGWVFFTLAFLTSLVRFALDHAERLEDQKKQEKLEEQLKDIMVQTAVAGSGEKFPKLVH